MESNEYMLDPLKEKESSEKNDDDDHINPPEGGCGSDQPEIVPENAGTLMLDATCTP